MQRSFQLKLAHQQSESQASAQQYNRQIREIKEQLAEEKRIHNSLLEKIQTLQGNPGSPRPSTSSTSPRPPITTSPTSRPSSIQQKTKPISKDTSGVTSKAGSLSANPNANKPKPKA